MIFGALGSHRVVDNGQGGALMTRLNIEPATKQLGELVRAIPDEQLNAPTPSDFSVGELLDHVQSFARAFAAGAAKSLDETTTGPPPPPDAARLGPDWRERIPALLDELAAAWNVPAAWEGMTKVGGMDMPGEVVGVIALDEIVLHGWDLAVATGHSYDVPTAMLEPLIPFLQHVAEPDMAPAREGLFGPVVPVSENAPLFDRVLGLAGRDPSWSR
jgi:uncharacterized protein (TIGR03086 family)